MNYITLSIITLTVLISIVGFSNPEIITKFIFNSDRIRKQKEFYRIITSQFIHADWAHLIFNMVSFYSFALSLETQYGHLPLFAIYFGSAIIGDILVLILKRKQQYLCLGASGAVSGIIFASIFLSPNSKIIIFPLPFPIAPWLFAILFISISIIALGRKNSNISHESHLSGALAGLIITFFLFQKQVLQQKTIALFTIIVIFIYLIYQFSKSTKKS